MKKPQERILRIKDLYLDFRHDLGRVRVLNGINLELFAGDSVALVGESGCGKTMTALSVLQLLPPQGILGAETAIEYTTKEGQVLDISKFGARSKAMRSIRGKEISIIFQEPISSLSPVHTVLDQVGEMLHIHTDLNDQQIKERVVELLKLVGIPKPVERVLQYPFQLSGGMRQRVMIAMALASKPRILIADEPTTALDVTTQAQVLRLIKEMQQQLGLALVLITHDLGVVTHMTDRINVVYLGYIVESGSTKTVLRDPAHYYTAGLLNSIPKMTGELKPLNVIRGSVPNLHEPPTGCPFHPRCEGVMGDVCRENMPDREDLDDQHWVRCFGRMAHPERVVGNASQQTDVG